MGLFEKIFKRPQRDPTGTWRTLTAYRPAFTTFEGEIYESELVRSSIHARATNISKLSVTFQGAAQPALVTRLRKRPNEWQTWSQMLYRLSTILDVNNTAFLVPVEGMHGETVGIYPVLPSRCEIVTFDPYPDPWIRYHFADGTAAAVELQRCGILTKYQYKDDMFGETNQSLQPTMDLIALQTQGIAEGVRAGATYRFMARVTNWSKDSDLVKERNRFTRENLEGEGGGILLFPNTYSDIKQIVAKPYTMDAAEVKLIEQRVYSYFGTNEEVVQNKAYGDEWNAFYEGAIEPFAVQLSQVLESMLFSPKEQAHGANVTVTANRLQYMSNADKLQVSSAAADRGLMCLDEIREIWNLPPLPNGAGKVFTIRGEYYVRNENGDYTKTGGEKNNDQ